MNPCVRERKVTCPLLSLLTINCLALLAVGVTFFIEIRDKTQYRHGFEIYVEPLVWFSLLAMVSSICFFVFLGKRALLSVTGLVALCIGLASLGLLMYRMQRIEAATVSPLSLARVRLNALAKAICTFQEDMDALPSVRLIQLEGEEFVAGFDWETLPTLTSPVTYISYRINDPFQGESWECAYFPTEKSGFVLWTPGPDHDFDLRLESSSDGLFQLSNSIVEVQYDPTNGSKSSGDVILFKSGRSASVMDSPRTAGNTVQ